MYSSNPTKVQLISVLIPLYNHEQFIGECLDSVLAQGLPNIELRLIDDGSSDQGFAVANAWVRQNGHHFVRVHLERQANAGITRTFDRLIRESVGDFIVILASDDVLLPGSISQRVKVLQDPAVMGVFGDAAPIDEVGNSIGTSAISELGNPADRKALSDPRTIHWELIFRWNVYGSVLMMRRDAIVTPDGKSILNLDVYSEDMQLYYMLGSKGALRYLDTPVAKYRVHMASASHSAPNLFRMQTNVYHSRLNAVNGMPWARAAVVRLQALTYFRWSKSKGAKLLLPLVAMAYASVWAARAFYDFYRKALLGQHKNA
jgi:glycosyltransferase involved in cell wall biosynthesis